jgi:cytochrome o ubiquinol oxidase subunit 1
MLGKLDWSAIPFDQPIPLITSLVLMLGMAGVLGLVTAKGWWGYLWREWITSVDHKRVGVMYCLLGGVMLVRGFADAVMMRSQQAMAVGAHEGYLEPRHYDQIFSAHGTIMIFFGAMPLVIGLMNFVTPLQLGVRDVAFPTLNSVSFWLTASGALLVNVSLFIGEFARTGWLPYPPLSETAYSPGVGVDYYLWAVQISGIGTLMTGINFVTTVLKLRCPGMTYLRMPMFCWTTLAASLLIVAAFPILSATLAMLSLDRVFGWHFFTADMGGNPMMFVNLIWAWGHPEVYILVLPAFGVFSEVFSTFSGKPLFGYRSMVIATMMICLVSMTVWLHHFFTMGAGPAVNTAFGIATSVIAVFTGVKIYNWIFTMYGGRVRMSVAMLWSLGFIVTFVIGGMTGVMLAVPPADFLVHNSMFLVAHFHNVIIGGVVFGVFAGIEYWFPKAFGFRLHPGWGKASFWLSLVGFWITFAPLYWLGMLGMTRRLQHVWIEDWAPLLDVALLGVVVLAAGAVCQVMMFVVSIRQREALRDESGDPWDGRSLEWATPSPPPFFNFATLPNVEGEEAYWTIKLKAIESQTRKGDDKKWEPVFGEKSPDNEGDEPHYEDIEMPKRSAVGFFTAFFVSVTGFSLIWHIWWLAGLGLLAAFAGFVVFAWRDVGEFHVPAEEVAREDRKRRAAREQVLARL